MNSSLEKDHNVIVRKDKRFDMLAVALQLHRAESGGCILYRQPSSQWFADMRTVSKSNLGNITLVMHPTIGGDFDGDHGVMIALVPGNLEGTVGGHGESFEEKRREIRYISELCNYGRRSRLGLNEGDFSIETGLEDAIRIRDGLNRVIRDARRLSKKAKLKKAA